MIYVLMGKSGTGKSTILNELTKNPYKLERIILDTTRPQRENETWGIDYNFLMPTEFIKKATAAFPNYLYSLYKVKNEEWLYGIDMRFSAGKDYICAVGPYMFWEMKTVLRDQLTSILIDTDDKTRLLNCLERETNPDCNEICRRFLSDEEQFELIEINSDAIDYRIKNDNKSLNNIVSEIEQIINITTCR